MDIENGVVLKIYEKDVDENGVLVIPQDVKGIGPFAGKILYTLKKLELPARLSTISRSAFEGCVRLEEICGGVRVKEIGCYAFEGCKKLNAVKFNDATKICAGAFANCENLKEASFTDVRKIGEKAFFNCNKLEELETTVKFREVGDLAFCKTKLGVDRILKKSPQVFTKYAFNENSIHLLNRSKTMEKNTETSKKEGLKKVSVENDSRTK